MGDYLGTRQGNERLEGMRLRTDGSKNSLSGCYCCLPLLVGKQPQVKSYKIEAVHAYRVDQAAVFSC